MQIGILIGLLVSLDILSDERKTSIAHITVVKKDDRNMYSY